MLQVLDSLFKDGDLIDQFFMRAGRLWHFVLSVIMNGVCKLKTKINYTCSVKYLYYLLDINRVVKWNIFGVS